MSTIYDWAPGSDGMPLTDGIQGSSVCDAAIDTALRLAAARGTQVLLEDDDGWWIVHPKGGVEEATRDMLRSCGMIDDEPPAAVWDEDETCTA